jgi:hypothetical protein
MTRAATAAAHGIKRLAAASTLGPHPDRGNAPAPPAPPPPPPPPRRMVLAPSGSALILGMNDGGVRRFQLDLSGPSPRLIEVSGERRGSFGGPSWVQLAAGQAPGVAALAGRARATGRGASRATGPHHVHA